jgi:hypothetical protein
MGKALHRDDRLDYLKGSCVLVMVVYHVVSMAAAYYRVEPVLSRLHFIHAGFLFISGTLVGGYYTARLAAGQAATVYWRLVLRGLKLCGVFLLLNVAVYASGMGYSFAQLRQIDSGGEVLRMLLLQPRGSLMAGEILWEIGLFLAVIAPLIVLLPMWCFYGIAVALWLAGLWGHIPFFLSIGTLGILTGWYLRDRDYGRVFQSKYVGTTVVGVWLLYLVYVVPVIQISIRIPTTAVAIATAEIILWLSLFTLLYQSRILRSADKYCRLYGKYTLVAYCLQLGTARVVAHVFHPEDFLLYCAAATVINVVAMHWVLRTIDAARGRSWIIDRGYRTVFV